MFSFLAPLFLGGLSLIAIPWIIHRIRKPERDTVRFSSLMFMPKITKEIIERRRIQHWLLMLLRMLILAVWVLAFARPGLRSPAAQTSNSQPAHHIILVDCSYSMGTTREPNSADAPNPGNIFDVAIEKAKEIVAGLRAEDKVGVIAFSDTPEIAAPLTLPEDADAGKADRARTAIDSLQVSHKKTSYAAALQLAQDQLLAVHSPSEENHGPLVIDLITDFQKNGFDENAGGWRVSPLIALNAVDVGRDGVKNQGVIDLNVKLAATGELRIQAKIKNWTSEEITSDVKLVVGDEIKQSKPLALKPGNASQVTFQMPVAGAPSIRGRIEIQADDLMLDNRRYFVWSPPAKKQILLVADERKDQQWPAGLFFERAIPQGGDFPWQVERIRQDQLVEHLSKAASPPDLILAADLNGIQPPAARAFLEYVEKGGVALLLLNPSIDSAQLNSEFQTALGIRSLGLRYSESQENRFALVEWINFEHPVFFPFKGTRYNDFSQIRFMNFQMLNVEESRLTGQPSMSILAKFEPDDKGHQWPAMVQTALKEGRVMIWSFGMDLASTNLAKNVKFVPLLHETLADLTQLEQARQTLLVGDPYSAHPKPTAAVENWTFRHADEKTELVPTAKLAEWKIAHLPNAGFIEWTPGTANGSEAPQSLVNAVNIRGEEADPRRLSVEDFNLRVLKDAGQAAEHAEAGQGLTTEEKLPVKSEFWQYFVAFMFVGMLFEGWYASRILR